MNQPAAIAAQLVDMRNVGAHKSLKLTLHVPEEQALAAIAAFGWPTGANPVPIAIARLREPTSKGGDVHRLEQPSDDKTPPVADTPAPPRAPRSFASLPLPQQAALLCTDPVFRAHLNEVHGADCDDEGGAAWALRTLCDVPSRRNLQPDTGPGRAFIAIREQFMAWKLVGA